MAYSHCRTHVQTLIRTLIPNTIVTLYYAEVFTLVSQMVTLPILGTDRHPNDRRLSQFSIFQLGVQSPNLNQCEISA